MAVSPVSGGLSPTALAALQQMRAARATTVAAKAAPPEATPVAPSSKPAVQTQGPVSAETFRGRGQIINILA
jgi:hypothetical protein